MNTPRQPMSCCGISVTDRYPEIWTDPVLPAEYLWVYCCSVCDQQKPVDVFTDADKAEVFEAANPPTCRVVVAP